MMMKLTLSSSHGDLPILCQRHTTSRLSSFQDLLRSTKSRGFRGKAIASMANVGHVTVTAITKDQRPHDYRATCKNGLMENDPKACAAVKGTQIMVEIETKNLHRERQNIPRDEKVIFRDGRGIYKRKREDTGGPPFRVPMLFIGSYDMHFSEVFYPHYHFRRTNRINFNLMDYHTVIGHIFQSHWLILMNSRPVGEEDRNEINQMCDDDDYDGYENAILNGDQRHIFHLYNISTGAIISLAPLPYEIGGIGNSSPVFAHLNAMEPTDEQAFLLVITMNGDWIRIFRRRLHYRAPAGDAYDPENDFDGPARRDGWFVWDIHDRYHKSRGFVSTPNGIFWADVDVGDLCVISGWEGMNITFRRWSFLQYHWKVDNAFGVVGVGVHSRELYFVLTLRDLMAIYNIIYNDEDSIQATRVQDLEGKNFYISDGYNCDNGFCLESTQHGNGRQYRILVFL